MSIRVIAEKPSSAGKIAAALGSAAKKAGYYEVKHGKDDVIVAPAVGHVYTLTQVSGNKSEYPVFEVKWAPSSEVSKDAAYTADYRKVIERLGKNVSEVVNACDWDIEGEVIGANLIKFAVNPKASKSRMQYSTLTSDELKDSFENRKPIDYNIVSAGETRHMLDWFYGINLSRALMGAVRSAGRFQVMSIGRVQGPMLALLTKREREILAFIPSPYWQLFADIKEVTFTHEKGKFIDKNEADTSLKNSVKNGKITKVEKKKYNQLPPFPYDLTSLQVDAYRNFGFAPTDTMKVAQSLYENAYISYPRTVSQQLSEKLNLKGIMEKISRQSNYTVLAEKLLKAGKTKPHNGPKTDPAHPAIHPTGQNPSKLNEREAKLYDLITRRFLACFADSAKRESQTVISTHGGENYKVTGSTTIEPGWLEYFGKYVKIEEVELPAFVEGEETNAKKIWMEEKMTKPPNRYSPSSIVKKLEEVDIGTKATRAEILETLFSRGYLANKKSIQVTPFGLSVIEALENRVPDLLSEELTREFDKDMEEISKGTQKQEKVITSGKQVLTKITTEFKAKEKEIGTDLVKGLTDHREQAAVLGKCNKCKEKDLVIRKSKFGLFVGCNGYPNCKNLFPLPKQAMIQASEKVCEKCGTPIILVIRKGKRPFNMCLDPKCETKANWASNKPKEDGAEDKSAAKTKKKTTASKKPRAKKKEE